MAYSLVGGHLKVEISLHTTAVHVGRHRIPYTTSGKFGHTHLQLACGQHLINYHLVDIALVAHLKRTHVSHYSISLCYFLARILLVGGSTVEVEFGGFRAILTCEYHVAVTSSDIQCLLE